MANVALIVVDIQNDFCEGGSMAVAGGREVGRRVAEYIRKHGHLYKSIVFTKDWHKPGSDNDGHISKEPDFQTSFPNHCNALSKGAAFTPEISEVYEELATERGFLTFYKGYGHGEMSGFNGTAIGDTTLDEYLTLKEIDTVHVVGIAGEFCVRATALDAIANDYLTVVIGRYVASVGGHEETAKTVDLIKEAQGL